MLTIKDTRDALGKLQAAQELVDEVLDVATDLRCDYSLSMSSQSLCDAIRSVVHRLKSMEQQACNALMFESDKSDKADVSDKSEKTDKEQHTPAPEKP